MNSRFRTGADKGGSMVDLSNCYLDHLGTDEEKLLAQLRQRVPEIIERAKGESEDVAALTEFTIWQKDITVPCDASDMILLKYLRAEELNLDKATDRLVATLVFRAECQIDQLADAEMPDHFKGHDELTGYDASGCPIVISRFGKMDLPLVFGDVEAFVRYRAKIMEMAMRRLKFERGTAEELCQVHDYSGVPLVGMPPEVKQGVTAVSKVFGEHYPETKGKTIFVNFPSVFGKLWKAFSGVIPERTRNKFVILGQGDVLALFEHLRPEVLPEALGGLLQAPPSSLTAAAHVVTIKARATEEAVCTKAEGPCAILWELRVCGANEVSYEVIFKPSREDAEDEIVQKSESKKFLTAEQGIVSGQYDAKEAGELRIRFRNECAWFKSRVCACRAQVKA
jgi:hypothetical protein